MSYVGGFGTGKSVLDYLLLPINLYIKSEHFSTSYSIEMPGLLFPLVIFYPFIRRKPAHNALFFMSILYFAAWAFSSQVSRYLLPIFPFLSVLVGAVLVSWEKRWQKIRIGYVLTQGLTLAMVLVTLIYNVLFFIKIRPVGVVLGLESSSSFLSRIVGDYTALEYIQTNLPDASRVLMLWDGRGYYCDQRCIPDIAHSQWADIVAQHKDVAAVIGYLRSRGITHLLYSAEDAAYITQHDPLGYQRKALDFLLSEVRLACTREIFNDSLIYMYELTCY